MAWPAWRNSTSFSSQKTQKKTPTKTVVAPRWQEDHTTQRSKAQQNNTKNNNKRTDTPRKTFQFVPFHRQGCQTTTSSQLVRQSGEHVVVHSEDLQLGQPADAGAQRGELVAEDECGRLGFWLEHRAMARVIFAAGSNLSYISLRNTFIFNKIRI